MAREARGIQSIEVSGRILKALVERCKPMMLKELAQEAALAPAQCHAYLTSMRHVGLVHQDAQTGHYQTGAFAMRLGISWLESSPVASRAIHALKKLTDETGAMSTLSVWSTAGPTIVHINSGVTPTALNLRQGSVFSTTGTATGRVFSAFDNVEAVRRQIDDELNTPGGSNRSIGITLLRDEFEDWMERTREQGYSTAFGAPIPDVNAVAAPIFDADGKLVFVATLIGPSDELPVDAASGEVRKLLDVTRAMSSNANAPEKPGHRNPEEDA
ncbi:MAG: IclR family transcriptional regulator [Nitratireductor sp.]|nr:IclR family transcriptional regulator [Nitratireductor sp.]MCB1459038.1 IclR family transcriptional regulator [Nitratireductor sp.]